MRTQWIGKGVDMELLGRRIEDFLLSKAIKIRKEKIKGDYVILGVPSELPVKYGRLTVKIDGKPDDFSVEFLSPHGGVVSKMTGLAALFGVGGFMLRRLKSEEYFEKLERDFWICVEKCVAELVGSAGHRPVDV